jgi:SAM-dependent methyltransferase
MHVTSQARMTEFVAQYLDKNAKLKILDIGAYDINGNYRHHFDNPNWTYVGLDQEAGPNVDIVVTDHDDWGINEEYDVVISGQALEHVKDMHKFIRNVEQALKPGGQTCIIAPNHGYASEHRCPVDCWRIMPDGLKFLFTEICNLDVVKVWIQDKDCIGIATK